jgi:hypothetical protein
MEGIITRSGVEIDRQVTSDGNGALRITFTAPTVVRLFEIGGIEVDGASLIYRARIRTDEVDGQVYLEMWCHFPGRGNFFSRGLQNPLTGTTDWVTGETPFLLREGERPDRVVLNLVANGRGTAWIDDVRLLKGPLG